MILDDEFYGSAFDFPGMLKKYALLLCSVFLIRTLGFIVLPFFYDDIGGMLGTDLRFWLPQSMTIISYLVNIVVAVVLYLDMQKERLMSYPILALAVFQNEGAVILFLLLIAYDKFWRRREIKN